MKQNRNDKCACGSGLKAKRCCIKQEAEKVAQTARMRREAWEKRRTVARSIGMPSTTTNIWAALAAMGQNRF